MNEDIISTAVALVCAYLLGSFPTAYIVGRFKKGVDIRKVGTRNMGAMNVFYKVGLVYGFLVLVVDIAKGVVAVILARYLDVPFVIQITAGGIAVIGHIFPIFLGFRGGKGGAVCVGVLACLMPKAIPFALGIFALALLITRYPTFSYSLGLLCSPFFAWLIYHSGELTLFSVIMLLILLARYLPRIIEIHSVSGNWHRALLRKGLKDRF